MMKRLWDPVNRVWCKVVPAGFTFEEWRANEDALVREAVFHSPVLRDEMVRRATEQFKQIRAQS